MEQTPTQSIDDLPEWTRRGGSFREGRYPLPWYQKKSGTQEGMWKRDEVIPYGKVNADYRSRFYTCAECSAALVPAAIPYKFQCTNCCLLFDYGNGGLQGFGAGHPKSKHGP
jgi:hypothetical protein